MPEATRWAGGRQQLWAKRQVGSWLWRECTREELVMEE